jgi:segregation and condensation protein B
VSAEREPRTPPPSAPAVEAAPVVEAELSFGEPIHTPPAGGRFLDRTRALDTVLTDLRGDAREREQQLEALLFSTHVPLTPAEIGKALGSPVEEVAAGIARLERALSERTSAVALFVREKNGERAFILDLKAAYRKDAAAVAPPMLKQAVTETLALIAINQPLSQSRLVRERGSTVYEHVKELMTRGLIQRQKKGRNFYLRTTDAFAGEFGLENDPELIRRALARAAGVERAPEVIGSPRVHLGEADVSPEALVAEALTCVPPEPLPLIEAPVEVAAQQAAPSDSIELEPTTKDEVEDCVVSGGEPPAADVPEVFVRETKVVKEEPETSVPPKVEEKQVEAPPSRIAHLLDLFQDQATTDDW